MLDDGTVPQIDCPSCYGRPVRECPDCGTEPQFNSDEVSLLRECVAFEMANVLIRAQWRGRTGYEDPRYVALVAVGRKLGIETDA